MKRFAQHILAGVLATALGLPVHAQDEGMPPATLIADSIDFDRGSSVITATGGVEIFYEGARLRVRAVSYDGTTDGIQVTGPLTLTEANGRTIIFADFADLSADLQNGVLRSARLVLDRQLQVAATEINRTDGRYTQMFQTVASTCEVCADNPVPLWEIRARQIVHDTQERQLYFDDASFRVLGVPIAYLPRLRLPDPTLDRATGFLTPSLRVSNETGTQLQLPYFIRLGDHRDLTLTPWIGTSDSRTVELRYRQAFWNGDIEVNSAISHDDLTEDEWRGYLFGQGRFDLQRDFVLDLSVQAVSDRSYLTTYGFPDTDLLESYVRASRARRDEYIEVGANSYFSLRDGDDNDILPTQVLNAEITRRFVPRTLGGIATMGLEGFGYYRFSSQDGPDGRDVARLSGFVDWRRDTILPGGVLLAVETAVYADIYNTWQGAGLTGTETRVAPFAGVELRYPLSRTSDRGVTHLIEPVVQLAWSDVSGGAVPIEDSRIVEFDEANLFQLDRFPGQDQRETGLRANIGLGYTRVDPLGWSLGVVGGIVIREEDQGQFTVGSGLNDVRSDFLLATHLTVDDRWRVINRALIDDDFTITSNELSLNWWGDQHTLGTTYTWLSADPAEGRPLDTAEWALDAAYDFDTGWQATANWRYDFAENQATRASLALAYANECVDMEFSVSRRFTSSATLDSATELGFTVSLNGFGASRSGRSHDRSCY